jgi:OmcA/MtrC family decaheme c-type cytochrome
MKHRPLKQLCGLFATAAIALMLIGCNGKDGQTGATGATGATGGQGPAGPAGPAGPPAANVLDATFMSADQWAALKPTVTITKVDLSTAKPEISFKITDPSGAVIKGLDAFSTLSTVADRSGNFATVANYPNLAFSIAKLVPEDNTPTSIAPSKWVSYLVTTVPTKTAAGAAVAVAPTTPTTDSNGTLSPMAADGTYKYTFYRDIKAINAFLDAYTGYSTTKLRADLGNVAYDSTKVHRLTVQFSGNARGTGSNTPNGVTSVTGVPMENPVNAIYDFMPATGLPVAAGTNIKDVISINKCNECHTKLAFHGGGRVEARYCVVCHTDQRKYGYAVAAAGTTTTFTGDTRKFNIDSAATQTTAAGDFPAMVHRIHMGAELTKTGYNYANVLFDKLGYSMLDNGQRMCIKCHQGVPQADNWKNRPTRLACGTCHDSVDFSAGHGGPASVPPQLNDNACGICHLPADITTYHMTVNQTPHNPTVAAGLTNFTYEISSATQAVSGGSVDIKFRILQSTNGSTPAPVTFLAATTPMANPLTGFTGSPSFQLAWAMQQDGVATPADFNNLLANDGAPSASNYQPRSVSIASLLDTAKATSDGTLAGPDASGYYTATIVGASRIIPAGAKLRQVGLQGYFTQISPAAARHAISVVKTITGDTSRRTVIDNNKCANCHEWFEGHGGNRVFNVQICVQCHVPGLVTSGKGISDTELSNYYNAGLFTANDKESLTKWTGIDFSTNPVTAGGVNVALAFPQTSNNMKDMIHGIHAGKDRTTPIAITRNRTPSAINVIDGARIGFPGILNNCQSCHTYNGYNVPTTGAILPTREQAINPVGNTTTVLAKAALAASNIGDVMITPFTAACVSCHDSAPAKAHMTINGGQIKVPRAALNIAGESCAVCHGSGSDFDPVKMHK